MENEKVVKKRKRGFAKVCSIVLDILIIPVIIIAFVCVLLTFSAKANNRVPSIFGMSIVTVVSESMEPQFKKGDVLVIKNTNTSSLKVGDDIAFYAPLYLDSPYTTVIDGKEYSKVIFHKIVRIVVDTDGEKHFVCMGTNIGDEKFFNKQDNFLYVGSGNGDFALEDGTFVIKKNGDYKIDLIGIEDDSNVTSSDIDSSDQIMQYVPEDMVVGIYDKGLSPTLGGIINFCASTQGMLALVIVPSILLIGLTIISLTKEVKKAKEEDEIERKVFEGNITKLKETSTKAKKELKQDQENKNEKQETKDEVDVHEVISNVSNKKQIKTQEAQNLEEKAKAPAVKQKATEPAKTIPKKAPAPANKTTAGDKAVKTIPKKIPAKVATSTQPTTTASSGTAPKAPPKKVPVKKTTSNE